MTVLSPVIVGLNAVANGVAAAARRRATDEVISTFTLEEVAALVDESHGEGLLEDERVRPARRRAGVHRATVDACCCRSTS